MVDAILARAQKPAEPTGTGNEPRERIAGELAAIESQIANLTEAIAIGGNLPSLIERLQTADSRRRDLVAQRDALGADPKAPRIDWRALERDARTRLADWSGLLVQDVPTAGGRLGECFRSFPSGRSRKTADEA